MVAIAKKKPGKGAGRPVRASRPKPARAAAKVKPAAKPKSSAHGKPAAAKGKAVALKGKPVVAGKGKVVPVKGKGKMPRPVAEVRPLGVLPASARAKGSDRPAPPIARPKPTPLKPAPAPTRAQGVQRVTEKDLKELEERLMTERQRILKEMGHLESTVLKVNPRDSAGDLSGYSFHMADAGTDAMEREKAFLFASSEGRALMEINAALRRLYNGEYGICESCGQPIGRARLEAMPHARLCVACKEKEERANRSAT